MVMWWWLPVRTVNAAPNLRNLVAMTQWEIGVGADPLKFRERRTVAFVTQPERRAVCAEPQLLRGGVSSYSEEHAWIFCSNGEARLRNEPALDDYVDHQEFSPLFRHFIEQVSALTGSVYGRRLYEVMRDWDRDHPEWSAEEAASAMHRR